jgi:hypothetical protein
VLADLCRKTATPVAGQLDDDERLKAQNRSNETESAIQI